MTTNHSIQPIHQRIINMSEEKGITYYAVRISYSDGSSDHYYNLRAHELKKALRFL